MSTQRATSFVLALLLTVPVTAAADVKLETEDQKTVYALGLVLAGQIAGFALSDAEQKIFLQGFMLIN